MPRIFYVDDERAIGAAVRAWLARRGIEVRRSHSLQGAKRCLPRYQFDGAFIDVWLGDGSGFDLYEHLLAHYPRLAERTAFVTGDTVPRPDVARRIAESGRPVVHKPFDLAELDAWVDVWVAAAARDAGARPGNGAPAPPDDRDRSRP